MEPFPVHDALLKSDDDFGDRETGCVDDQEHHWEDDCYGDAEHVFEDELQVQVGGKLYDFEAEDCGDKGERSLGK